MDRVSAPVKSLLKCNYVPFTIHPSIVVGLLLSGAVVVAGGAVLDEVGLRVEVAQTPL